MVNQIYFKIAGLVDLDMVHILKLTSISYSFWNITQKVLKLKKKIDRRAEPPDIFLEENHPMTISSKFCSYWANGFKQEDFYGNFPYGPMLN